jgi:hypothetical protein
MMRNTVWGLMVSNRIQSTGDIEQSPWPSPHSTTGGREKELRDKEAYLSPGMMSLHQLILWFIPRAPRLHF